MTREILSVIFKIVDSRRSGSLKGKLFFPNQLPDNKNNTIFWQIKLNKKIILTLHSYTSLPMEFWILKYHIVFVVVRLSAADRIIYVVSKSFKKSFKWKKGEFLFWNMYLLLQVENLDSLTYLEKNEVHSYL